jgi:hypothetical protein
MSNDIATFFEELGAGTFEERVRRALVETTLSVMENERTGEMVLRFKIKPVGISQANITHEIEYKAPTKHGIKTEKSKTETVMHVGAKGVLSLFPEKQDQLFTMKGEPARN